MNELQTGVYEIVYVGTLAVGRVAKRYIGSTGRAFDIRWREHRYNLNRGVHACRYLQMAWSKHGESCFEFRVIDRLPFEDAQRSEQSYLDAEAALRKASNNGRGLLYNRSMNATGGAWELTPEISAKMSESQRQRNPNTQPCGDRHGSKTHPERVVRGDAQWMRKYPERVRRGRDACPFPERMIRGDDHWTRRNPGATKGENNAASKLTTANVIDLRRRYTAGETQALLAAAFNIQQSAVSRIIAGKRWSHVQDPQTQD